MGHIHIDLVKGNHDILKDAWYKDAAITIHKHLLKIGNFTFVHDINDCSEEDDTYCFSGHIHPGVKIRGVGRQALQLACFYFGKKHAVLPAFGRFTGTYPVQPLKGDVIFGLVDKGVVRIL